MDKITKVHINKLTFLGIVSFFVSLEVPKKFCYPFLKVLTNIASISIQHLGMRDCVSLYNVHPAHAYKLNTVEATATNFERTKYLIQCSLYPMYKICVFNWMGQTFCLLYLGIRYNPSSLY